MTKERSHLLLPKVSFSNVIIELNSLVSHYHQATGFLHNKCKSLERSNLGETGRNREKTITHLKNSRNSPLRLENDDVPVSLQVLGMGQEWLGGDMNYAGGGYKVNLLKKELEEHKDKPNLVILFTDAYDVIFTGDDKEILAKFNEFDAKIVFGAEGFCWPKESLAEKYPEARTV